MRFLILLLAVNTLVVASFWTYHHFMAPDDGLLRIAWRLILFGGVALPALLWWAKRRTVITPTLLALLTSVGALTIALFLAQAYLFPALFPGLVRYVVTADVLQATLHAGKLLLTLLAGYAFFTLALFLMGKCLLRLFPRIPLQVLPDTLRPFLIGTIGAFGWIILIHLFDWTGWLSQGALLGAFGLLIAREWRTCIDHLRRLRSARIPLAWPGWVGAFVLSLLLFLVVLQIGDSLRPAPTGYDDMTHYLNQVRLMTDRQALITSHWPASFETLLTGWAIATGSDDQFFPLSLGSYGILITTLLIFLFGRHAFGTRTGVLAAAVFLSLPMTGALSIMETKPDSWLVALVLIAIWTFLSIKEEREFWIIPMIALLLGMAATFKLTALLFVPALVWLIGSRLWEARLCWRRTASLLGLSLLFALLPWTPWALHTAIDRLEHQSQPVLEKTLQEDLQELTTILSCQATGSAEDFARFVTPHESRWPSAVFLPWDITLNITVRSFATEVGCLLLALLPWLFIAFQTKGRVVNDTAQSERITLASLSFISLITLIFWAYVGQGVPWYFFPALAPLFLVAAWIVEREYRSRLLALFLSLFFLAALLGQTVVRMKFSLIDAALRYGAGQATTIEYIDTALPGYAKVSEYANADPKARIIVTGSRSWYAIENNDRRAVMDQHLDILSCLIRELGPEAAARKLRELDIRYILFSKDQVRQMRENSRPTFAAKVRDFTDFSAVYLRPVWGSESHLLFELAPSKRIR